MKFTKIAMAMVFATMIVASCNTVKDALDVTFDTSFKAPFNINVPSGTKAGVDGTFAESLTIDPLSDPDIEQYADNIKSFEVTGVTGTITAINKDVTLNNMVVSVTSGTKVASWTFTNQQISQGTQLVLSNDNGQWDTVNSILNDLTVFTASVAGDTDEDGVQFTYELEIAIRVVANPLQ